MRLQKFVQSKIIIEEPIVNEGFFHFVCEERSDACFKELVVLELQEEIELVRAVF